MALLCCPCLSVSAAERSLADGHLEAGIPVVTEPADLCCTFYPLADIFVYLLGSPLDATEL